MSEKQHTKEISDAIVAGADKDFATFRDSIGRAVEDRMTVVVQAKTSEIRQNLFKKGQEGDG